MTSLLFVGGTFWLACIVFVTDLVVPTGVAVGRGYAGLVITGIWGPWRNYFYWAAAAGTLLTVMGFFFSPMSGEPWKAITNRGLSILMVWVTAILCLRGQPSVDSHGKSSQNLNDPAKNS